MAKMTRARAMAGALLATLLTVPVLGAQTQSAVITGKVTSEFGQPIVAANVYITSLTISVPTNALGEYTITIPSARVAGQQVNLHVRGIGFQPGLRPVSITAGSQTQNFSLKQDINRLSEVVVTGSIEGTERSKVPFSIGRVTAEDIPVPGLDPLRSLQGKVSGLRIAGNGAPGSTPEIMLRGPTSINATGRSQEPLLIVDGVKIIGSLDELGGLDIESVEVVKGAAGGSIYGTTAANGVIVVKTKRGNNQEGVKFNFRSEYGTTDVSSLSYGQPENHPLQLDETGKRFCVGGSSNVAACSRTVDWMTEILRINNVNADTIRTGYALQYGQPAVAGGELLNVFQAQIWPNQYYDTFAQISTRNPVTLNSLDASGKIGDVRFFVSGAYTDDKGSIRGINGQQQRRGRVNLDYNVRNNLSVSISSLFDRGTTDNHSVAFGTLLRGSPPGTNYLARDTLGRTLVRGMGPTSRPTTNGSAGFFNSIENEQLYRISERYLANLNATYFPMDWVTFEGAFGYDNRQRIDTDAEIKGYRTSSVSTADNLGYMSLGNRSEEAYNGSLGATVRRQLTNDLSGRLNVKGSYDSDYLVSNSGSGQQFVVKDIYTLSNTTLNKTATSSSSTVKNMGVFGGAQLDYKGRYIVDGTYRYDGSSLFGEGNRWAPFGRLSGVWRVSEESFWHLSSISDFRLRASRGTAGSTPSFTAQYETYSCGVTGCSLGQAGNSKLKPETTTETEIGGEFTLFNRLGVDVTHATSDTRNQILNVPTPASLGFSNQWQNAGTLSNNTWELGLNLPVVNRRDLQWSMRGTWDRTRTYITELFMPEYFTTAGTGQGTGSFFLMTARTDKQDGIQVNRYGNIWGRKFYKTCGDMPSSVQAQCGAGKAYQVDNNGWVVWVGEGNSYKDGITKNLWQTKLPAALSPWNYPLQFGHPIVDRPLKGEKGEGIGTLHILGNTLPDFNLTLSNNVQYKRLTVYGLLQGTFGHEINNQGEGWGLLDFSSHYFDQSGNTVETAKPLGYGWRVGGSEGAGVGGFYDILGPNSYNVESGSYAKLREVSVNYKLGRVGGVGDWTVGIIGRNLWTFTNYTGYDPETGVSGSGQANSGLINQVDNGGFPVLRQFNFSVSTRF
jgi:TonB-linked SusC/RagA family outer membrane protein